MTTSETNPTSSEGEALQDSTYGVGLIKFSEPTSALRYLAKRLRKAGISDAVADDFAESIEFLIARRDDLAAPTIPQAAEVPGFVPPKENQA